MWGGSSAPAWTPSVVTLLPGLLETRALLELDLLLHPHRVEMPSLPSATNPVLGTDSFQPPSSLLPTKLGHSSPNFSQFWGSRSFTWERFLLFNSPGKLHPRKEI